jgi:hypothetical protein
VEASTVGLDNPRARRSDVAVASAAIPAKPAIRNETIERTIFWLFVAALAWAPFWYGSNDLVAWGVNALLFPGMAALYEISILIRGQGHPMGVRTLAVPTGLFAAAVVWIWIQNLTLVGMPVAHPIWEMAADALDRPIMGSISVNRDLTTLALVRLITAASAFWMAVQLCRNAARATLLIIAVAVSACAYSAYGLAAFAIRAGRVPWLEIPATVGFVSSSFINRNSFATYAGIGLICICGLVLRLYRHEAGMEGPRRLRIASLIEATGRRGAALVGGAFLIGIALLLTGSRAGAISAGIGLLVLGLLTFTHAKGRAAQPIGAMILGALLVVPILLGFGDALLGSIARRGIGDTARAEVYLTTLRSIFDAPLSGNGYGTFIDVFPMYRGRSIGVEGIWEQAHNTYLEIFQGLGLVFGSMLIAGGLLLVLRCLRAATARQGNVTIPRVATGVAVLVGVHALLDFSLQIQAVTLTFMAVLGAGVGQSESSRLALGD